MCFKAAIFISFIFFFFYISYDFRKEKKNANKWQTHKEIKSKQNQSTFGMHDGSAKDAKCNHIS
jgi:hypothetical protein